MKKKEFSIPANYSVEQFNGLYGIRRKTSKGTNWFWDAIYTELIVAKTYGKIMIAHCSSLDRANGREYLTLTDYKGGIAFNLPVYDIIFGANFLYVLTDNPQTNAMEWAYVKEGFKGGKFLGSIDFTVRDRDNYNMMPISTTTVNVEVGTGDEKKVRKFDLMKAELCEEETYVVPPKVVAEVVEFCKVNVDMQSGRLVGFNAKTGKPYKRTTAIGEIAAYAPILPILLGDLTAVPAETFDAMVDLISRIENYGNAIILMTLYERATNLAAGAPKGDILRLMLHDLDTGWSELMLDKECKAYISGSMLLVAVKNTNGKAVFTPYDIVENLNGALDMNDVEAINTFFEKSGTIQGKLELTKTKDTQTVIDGDKMLPPYAIRNNPVAAKDVSKYSYEIVKTCVAEMQINGLDGKAYGCIELCITLCNNFQYRAKPVGAKAEGLTRTNLISVAIG